MGCTVRAPLTAHQRSVLRRRDGRPTASVGAEASAYIPPGGTTQVRDVLFVAVIIAASTVQYVARLGFASDDWAFLGSLTTHGDLSAPGRSVEHDFATYLEARPVQVAYQTLEFDAFGPNPLGYHLVNTVVLAVMGALGYLVLRELAVPRLPAVAVAVTYGLLPHYSTDRFWWAAFGYSAAMTLALASMYADLRAVRSRGAALWLWKTAALATLAGAGLGYEIALPLLVAAVPLLWYRSRRLAGGPLSSKIGRVGATVFFGSNILVLSAIVAFKLAFAVGVGVDGNYVQHLARLALGSATTSFGSYGVGLLESTRWAVATVDSGTMAVGLTLAAVIAVYLGTLGRQDASRTWTIGNWLGLLAGGVLVFVLGYGIFLTNGRVLFSSSGISNRVSIVAAAGVAMIWIGLAGVVTATVPPRWRAWVFAVPVAALCLSGFLIVHGLAASWAEAWQRQQAILADIRTRLPTLETGTTIILDGTCPYVGPGIVFESNWDLAGALETRYGDPTVRADVVSANLSVDEEGLSTRLYVDHIARYEYDRRLLVFDARNSAVRPLPDTDTARAWWATRQEPDCPRGGAGYGTVLFSWDGWYRRFETAYLWG
jgi:hypothetical protein